MTTVNDTDFRYEDEPQDVELFRGYPAPLLHFATICCVLFILLGIPGNLGTIIALYRCKKVRNATAVFIMNLSVSDLMFCCFNLPLAASTFYSRSWRHGKLLCQLFPLLRYGLLAVSLFTVLAITINRYVMIGHPTLYPALYRKEYLGLMVACTWVCGFGALVATWLGVWGQFGLDRQIGSCSILPDEKGRSPKSFLFVVAFVIPCVAIVVCYARIFYIVRITALKSHSGARATTAPRRRPAAPSPGGSATTSRKACKSKEAASREDSAIGTSTTGTSATASTERSSSAFCEGGHWKSGADKSPAALEREAEHRTRSNANPMHGRAKQFEDDPCGRDGLEQKSLPNPSFVHGRASSETDVHLVEGEIGGRDRASDARGAERPREGDRVDDGKCDRGRPAYLAVPAADDDSRSGRSTRKKRIINLGFVLRGSESARGGGSRGSSSAGKMSTKDKKLLKMILVIFLSFLVCYLPITISKTFRHVLEIHSLNIAGYVLIYLTTCMNPIIYVVMSSEYRQAYKNLLTCRGTDAMHQNRSGSQK